MKTAKFKTTLKCAACVNTVSQSLNDTVGQEHWQVDLASPERILTVESDSITPEKVVETLSKLGYKAELLERI